MKENQPTKSDTWRYVPHFHLSLLSSLHQNSLQNPSLLQHHSIFMAYSPRVVITQQNSCWMLVSILLSLTLMKILLTNFALMAFHLYFSYIYFILFNYFYTIVLFLWWLLFVLLDFIGRIWVWNIWWSSYF